MKKREILTKEQFIQKYIEYIEGMKFCMEKNNYKKNNVLAKKFNQFIITHEKEEYFEEGMYDLMNVEQENIKVSAACNSLRHEIHIKYAINVLEKIKKMGKGFDSFHAEIALKNYYGEIPNRKL